MIDVSEPIMFQAGLEVKSAKCALFHDRRSGNNWYKGRADTVPQIKVQSNIIPVYKRNESYKYLGKSLSLCGEDEHQITEIVDTYKILVDQIKSSELPLALKCSAFNNLALAKVLHHFYNTRLPENLLDSMEKHLVSTIREMLKLYKSTSQLAIFLPRENGGLGIKKLSIVYYTTRIAFLVNILNHNVDNFRFLARESLKLDMNKRNIKLAENSESSFLGYELNENGFLNCKNTFGCQSDWLELSRYVRKIDACVDFVNDVATVKINNEVINPTPTLQNALYSYCMKDLLRKANDLSIQGSFFRLSNINKKCSNSIFYNWNVSDNLYIFAIKSRLSILPTNFTIHLWDKEKNPRCPFGCFHTESMAHLLNGCSCIDTFGNFYSRRHNRVVNIIAEFLSRSVSGYRIYVEKHTDSVLQELAEPIKNLPHRKPDIHVIDYLSKKCFIVEITICYDLYLEFAYNAKIERYEPLINVLRENGYETNLLVLCFGSLGSVRSNVYNCLRKFSTDKSYIKDIMKWCSISSIIGSNFIWRHRVKKLLA